MVPVCSRFLLFSHEHVRPSEGFIPARAPALPAQGGASLCPALPFVLLAQRSPAPKAAEGAGPGGRGGDPCWEEGTRPLNQK